MDGAEAEVSWRWMRSQQNHKWMCPMEVSSDPNMTMPMSRLARAEHDEQEHDEVEGQHGQRQ